MSETSPFREKRCLPINTAEEILFRNPSLQGGANRTAPDPPLTWSQSMDGADGGLKHCSQKTENRLNGDADHLPLSPVPGNRCDDLNGPQP